MKSSSTLEQLKSILALPFMALVVIPVSINYLISDFNFNPIFGWNKNVVYGFGILFLLLGLSFFIQSIFLFVKIGKGTLAPWNPTKKLVVISLYRHVRNPMILGVFIILLSESFLFKSLVILVWPMIFLLINHLYFILKEEPDLLKRFGEEYHEYLDNVPRWIPRIRGWRPEDN